MNDHQPGTPATRTTGINLNLLILALLLAFPSTGFVQKYAGLAGVAAYVAIVTGVVFLTAKLAASYAPFLVRNFRSLSAVALVGMLGSHVLLHPYEDGRGPGRSSDRDEGLELAVTRMADGESPYYPQNKTAGPLSLLPGAILLSAPFVAVGYVGLQNWFWLAVFLFASAWYFRDKALALLLLAVPLALSPAAQYEYVSGGDMIANGIYVAVFLLLALRCWSAPTLAFLPALASCLLLGIGLASRANFILLLPLFGALIWRLAGPRRAVASSAMVLFFHAAVTLPFYLNDPAGFTPLMSRDKLAVVNHALPWADKAMIGITLLAVAVSSGMILLGRKECPARGFFRHCTVVTLLPMVCAVIASSVYSGSPDFRFMHDRFGLMYVFFALLGWGGCVRSNHRPIDGQCRSLEC